jgi:GH35 family endo-1,4-beta-xylanase
MTSFVSRTVLPASVVLFASTLVMGAGQKFFGCCYTPQSNPVYETKFKEIFNMVVPENAGKWDDVEDTRGIFVWGDFDKMAAMAASGNMILKEHTFVWGSGSGQPPWLSGIANSDTVKAIVRDWMSHLLTRYPQVQLIDVVNEFLHAPAQFRDYLGGYGATGFDWIILCYQTARDLSPQGKLILNEYNLLRNEYGDINTVLTVGRLLKARGLIDGIGEQGHDIDTLPAALIKQSLDSLSTLSIPVYITELDLGSPDFVVNDSAQLNTYQRVFPLLWEHPNVAGITLWGFFQGNMYRNDAYLVRTDGSERPALTWLRGYLSNHTASLDPDRKAVILTGGKQLCIFPNPSRGHMTIALPGQDLSQAILYSLMGQRMYSQSFAGKRNFEVNLSGIPNGQYIMRTIAGGREESHTVNIVR